MTGEAGWSPDQWGHSRFKTVNASADSTSSQKSLTAFMRALLKASSLRLFLSPVVITFKFFIHIAFITLIIHATVILKGCYNLNTMVLLTCNLCKMIKHKN